jgi:hypothetical protein
VARLAGLDEKQCSWPFDVTLFFLNCCLGEFPHSTKTRCSTVCDLSATNGCRYSNTVFIHAMRKVSDFGDSRSERSGLHIIGVFSSNFSIPGTVKTLI